MNDDCVLKKGVKCSLKIFMIYFFLISYIYTIALTFSPHSIQFIKDRYTSWKGNTEAAKDEDKTIEKDDELKVEEISIKSQMGERPF